MSEPIGITIIRGRIAEIRAKYPEIKDESLDANGAIYYANGNDGTKFDWLINDRLCEFMVYHADGHGFIKMCVNRDETMNIYIYPNGAISPAEEITIDDCGFNTYELCSIMKRAADDRELWDQKIDELYFN